MRRARRPVGISLGFSLLFLWSALSTAYARPPQPAPASTCAATSVTLANQNSYPIWIGENVSAGAILTPPGNNWQLGAGDSVNLCVPADWTSGSFWARTECNFSGTFGQDSNYADCTSASQCGQTPNAHICYGGKCVIDCSTSTGTNGNCSSLANSVCVAAAGSASGNFTAGSFCGFAGGVCRTGDCGSGLFQCQGTWDSLTADFGPETPASQFEITDTSAADGGLGAATYDVTNLAGYNNPIDVALDFTPSGTNPACYATSCNTDLNTICPSLLQVIEPPTGSSGSCGTNNATCQTGFCESCPSGADPTSCNGGSTCVIGCNGPGKLCGSSYPSPVSAPGVTDLECDTTIPGFTAAGQLAQYRDMYDAANDSGIAVSSDIGVTMFSGNQGTPTCWGDIDCAPGETCLIGPTATGISGLPSGVGICAVPNPGGTPTALQVTDCNSTSDNGNLCGGYASVSSPVYSCVLASGVSSGVACLPAYDPPISGIGTYDTTTGFFTGIGAPINPEWEAAALWAAGNGTTAGTTPYYETFSNACPHQYAWTYDDHTGGLACNGYPLTFTVSFGELSGSPSPTATTTPTATPTSTASATPTATVAGATASATPTATATSTATSTATLSPTPTATATASATGTATPTATASATPTGTVTATPTSTATPTATATMTPTPSGTATPDCVPNIYLSTNPSGTLAFGDVKVKRSAKASLIITNGEPAGSLKLSTNIQGGQATDFSVTGGSCAIGKLKAGKSCTYKLTFKGKKQVLGGVSSNLLVSGSFAQGVCPAGDVQSKTVTLSGFVVAPSK
jgi:hypothetical protein